MNPGLVLLALVAVACGVSAGAARNAQQKIAVALTPMTRIDECLPQSMSAIASEIGRVQPSKELRNRAVERESNRDNLAGTGVSLPPLNPADVVTVGLASAGQSLLR